MWIKKYKKYLIIIMAFLFISIISFFLLLHTRMLYSTGDLHFHLRRIMELYDSIRNGQLFPLFSLNYSHGSFVMGMYPYISILPIISIIFMVHSIVISYYLFIILTVFMAMLISFFSSLKFSDSKSVSFLFSIIYGTSSLFISSAFITGDLGILTSLVFLPLAIFGFIDMLYDYSKYIKFVLGIVGLLCCQLPSSVIVLGFVIIWMLINLIIKYNKHLLLNFLKSLLLIILITGYIWVPLIYFLYKNKIHSVYSVVLSGTSLKGFVMYLGIIPIISIVILLFYIHTFNIIQKQMYLFSICIIFLSSKIIPWKFITSIKLLQFLNIFQYLSRFLIIPQILLCYLISYVLIRYIIRRNDVEFISSISVIILIQIIFQGIICNYKINITQVNLNNFNAVQKYCTKRLGYKNIRYKISDKNAVIEYFAHMPFNTSDYDYYPKNAMLKRKYIDNSLVHYKYNKNIKLKYIGFNKSEFINKSNKRKCLLPLVKYNGETLRIYDNNKLINYHVYHNVIELNKSYKGINLIRIKLNNNFVINIIRLITFIFGLIWLYNYWVFNKKRISKK